MKQGRAVALRRPVALSIAAALSVLALWLWLRDDGARANRSKSARGEPAARDEPPVGAAPRLERAPPREAPTSPPEPVAEEHHHQPGDPSHPITPEHLRLYRESGMMFDIDNAIMARDHEAIRRLNYAYKQEFPGDKYAVQEAYEIIADCLEKKTPERVARARAFWEKRRSSRARRDMRKICLQ